MTAAPDALWDYIIVGAGSAGCVLAERLTVDPAIRVLLVEAGGEADSPLIPIPAGIGRTLVDPKLTWFFATEPDPGNAHRPAIWLRGKVIGGSSSINGMIYCRGHRQDYDDWEAQGCPGWGWRDMAPVFRKMEDHALGGGGKRGVGGPLHVSIQALQSPLTEALLDAGADVGAPRVEDVNEGDGPGLGYTPVTMRKGRRVSANDAFLKRARQRPNLDVVTNTQVSRILFEDRRAVGIEAVRDGAPVTFRTRGEVILSAGAIMSPKILMLSGIGAEATLREHGIPVVVDSPGVGQHMREHKVITLKVELNDNHSYNQRLQGLRLYAEAARYALTRTGALTTTYDLNGFIRTDPAMGRPNAQVTFWSLSLKDSAAGIELDDFPGMNVMGYPCLTDSEGSITLRSADPADPPLIHTNFLASEHDRSVIIGIFRFMRRIFAHPKVAPLIKQERHPGPAVESDEEILDAARRDGTCLHATGTCSMGDAPDAVVDARLRVRGVSGLRVMDCSVLPTQISGNTNGPVMGMAWRASELFLEDRGMPATTAPA
jgi:choline dehydrogenase